MKQLPRLAICLCLFHWLVLPLQASDLPGHRVGDVAETDVITPVALEVVDSAATAALQSAKATQYPAVFRSLPERTNEMTRDFLAAFAQARTNFLADLAAEFHAAKLDEAAIASPDFGGLITSYGVKHKRFPIPEGLAADWARGGDGQALREQLLASLMQAANRQVRPDTLPEGMIVGESIRLTPVTEEHQKLSFEAVQAGRLVPTASIMTVSNLRSLYRRAFPARQQLFARAMADFLQPNCLPDAPFTDLTRGTAVCKLMVSDHFDAGDVIIHRGEKMDVKTLAALAKLDEKLRVGGSSPSHPPAALAESPPKPLPPPTPAAAPPAAAAPSAPVTAATTSAPTPVRLVASAPAKPQPLLPPPTAAGAGLRHQELILTLAGVSVAALLVAVWLTVRSKTQAASQNRKTSRVQSAKPDPQTAAPAAATGGSAIAGEELLAKFSVRDARPQPAGQAPLPFPDAIPANLTPQVTQAVREAVQQELGAQRHELLLAQLAATDKISLLVQRLDELQVPMEARLRTYETRIQMLEKELALSNAENRELLKTKIEMVSRQLAVERAAAAPAAESISSQ